MKSIQNILEGLLDDDFADKLGDHIIEGTITKLWNKFLAQMVITDEKRDYISYQEVMSTVEELAKAAKIRPTKTWPLKPTLEASPYFIMTFKNLEMIIIFDQDLYINYWYKSEWNPKGEVVGRHDEGWSIMNTKEVFLKFGKDMKIELYSRRGTGSYDIDPSKAIVYKLPADFTKPEDRLSIYGARQHSLAELKQIIANG